MAGTTESGSICSLAELKPEKALLCPISHWCSLEVTASGWAYGQSRVVATQPVPMPFPPWSGAPACLTMCNVDNFHPLSLPVLRCWLQEEAVMVRTTAGDVLSPCLPATSWVRRGQLVIVCGQIFPGACDSSPEDTKAKLPPLGFPNPSHSPMEV